jgi:hypothetical protein
MPHASVLASHRSSGGSWCRISRSSEHHAARSVVWPTVLRDGGARVSPPAKMAVRCWLEPFLVARIEFLEWTPDRLRLTDARCPRVLTRPEPVVFARHRWQAVLKAQSSPTATYICRPANRSSPCLGSRRTEGVTSQGRIKRGPSPAPKRNGRGKRIGPQSAVPLGSSPAACQPVQGKVREPLLFQVQFFNLSKAGELK